MPVDILEDETALQHLTEEEKKNREALKTKHEEEVKLKSVEEKKVRDDKFAKLDELGKIQCLIDEK